MGLKKIVADKEKHDKELKEFNEEFMKIQTHQWNDLRPAATSKAFDIYNEEGLEMKEPDFSLFIDTCQENIALNIGLVPPYFTGIFECENCGTMPGPKGLHKCIACPWCHTDAGGEIDPEYVSPLAQLD